MLWILQKNLIFLLEHKKISYICAVGVLAPMLGRK